MMDFDAVYENFECRSIEDTTGPPILNQRQDEGKDEKQRELWPLVLTVSLGLICVLLLAFIIWLSISITAERDLLKKYETTVQELDHTVKNLQTKYSDLRTEKDQLKKNLNSLSQKNQESETRVNALGAEKEQLQQRVKRLENSSMSLTEELKKVKQGEVFMTNEAKNWSEIRQYCRDHGADLVIIKTEEKQRVLSSFFKDNVWIGLSDTENEGRMKWVDNSTLNQGQGFWLSGQPNNYDDQDCIEMNYEKDPLKNWNDYWCSSQKKGVCEK